MNFAAFLSKDWAKLPETHTLPVKGAVLQNSEEDVAFDKLLDRWMFIKNNEFCIKNGDVCIKNGAFCIKNGDLRILKWWILYYNDKVTCRAQTVRFSYQNDSFFYQNDWFSY